MAERPNYTNNSQTVVVDADHFEFETIEETKAFIAAEVPKNVALLKKAGFEAQ